MYSASLSNESPMKDTKCSACGGVFFTDIETDLCKRCTLAMVSSALPILTFAQLHEVRQTLAEKLGLIELRVTKRKEK